jgi:hypothetical protein
MASQQESARFTDIGLLERILDLDVSNQKKEEKINR